MNNIKYHLWVTSFCDLFWYQRRHPWPKNPPPQISPPLLLPSILKVDPPSPPLLMLTISSLKLTNSNYIYRKTQMLLFLDGQNLLVIKQIYRLFFLFQLQPIAFYITVCTVPNSCIKIKFGIISDLVF